MTKEEIGLFVLKERKKQKLSQKGLADKADLARYQQIMEIETASVNYGIDVLIKVVNALNFEIIINDPGWEERVNKEVNDTVSLFDFSKVESIKPEPEEKVVGKLKNKIVSLPFKRKK